MTATSGINNDGKCSLVEAIINANNDAATYADCVAGSGADTITLPTNATFDYSTTYGSTAALPNVTSTITIEGNGSTIQRTGGPEFRILDVYSGGDLTLNHATISGGDVSTSSVGGGILVVTGALTLNYSTVSGNKAFFGGGIYNNHGTVTLSNHSMVSGNYATGSGCATFWVGASRICRAVPSNSIRARSAAIMLFWGVAEFSMSAPSQ